MRRLRENEEFREEHKVLTFDEKVLQERFDYITTYEGLPLYDLEHVFERFDERHSQYDEQDLLDVIFDGIDEIKKDYGLKVYGQYMIISRSMGIKVALEVRQDRKNPNHFIGAIPTILDKDEHPFNLRGEIEIFVEASMKTKQYAIGHYENTAFYEVIQDGRRLYRYDRIFVD